MKVLIMNTQRQPSVSIHTSPKHNIKYGCKQRQRAQALLHQRSKKSNARAFRFVNISISVFRSTKKIQSSFNLKILTIVTSMREIHLIV